MVPIEKFGEQLLTTGDLDPVYIVVWGASLNPTQLRKWLLAYWCFYHVGTASWIVDQESYWDAMASAAASSAYPRSRERRHYRGQNAIDSVSWLRERRVGNLFLPWCQDRSYQLEELVSYVRSWKQYGPWIAFKAADMLERLGVCRVEFGDGSLLMFDSPRLGAELLWSKCRSSDCPDKLTVCKWASDYILDRLGTRLAPPRYERPINVQETETILCKWHASAGKHPYRIGEDIEAVYKGLKWRGGGPTADKLFKAGEVTKLW